MTKRWVWTITLGLAAVLGAWWYLHASGFVLILLATLVPAQFVAAARIASGASARTSRLAGFLDGALTAIVSLGATMLALEVGLAVLARSAPKDVGAEQPASALTIPDEWKQRPTEIAGAVRAEYWHGKLHVYNQDGFRNAGDYVREDGKKRIVVLGDSLTYGAGIAAQDGYPALLEGIWQRIDPTMRIYNLGHSGYQSEDIVRVARKWLPILAPERVLYGICLNDFLPSGIGQYQNNMALQIPLPKSIKEPIETRTRVGATFSDLYNRALIRLNIRNDFIDDILKDFSNYQGRFRRDLAELNEVVLAETGKPVLAMVVDQAPADERGRRIAQVAEVAAADAGMEVVPTAPYYEQYGHSNVQLYVSKWEGHPNEVANRIFAEIFARKLGLAGDATAAIVTPERGTE